MDELPKSAPIFREVQGFRQVWLWIVVLVAAAISWRLALKLHVLRWPLPHTTGRIILLAAWLVLGMVAPILLFSARLVTEVHKEGIFVRLLPFQRSFIKISFSEFRRYEMLVCRPLYDYGGWGPQGYKGPVYNMGSFHAIQLSFIDGREMLIGSNQARNFLQAIHSQCAPQKRRVGSLL